MKKIKGIYTFIETQEDFKLCDYEIMILIMSLMKWKKLYGPTKLFTDGKGFNYLTELGVIDLWDEVDKELLHSLDNSKKITDAYKIEVLKSLESPFCMLERDTIIQEKLGMKNKDFWEGDLIFPYIEKNGEMSIPITNFIYFNNNEVLRTYINKAIVLCQENSNINSVEEIFKFNIELNLNLFKDFLEDDTLKINYIFEQPWDITFPPSWPFTTVNDPLTGPIYLLSRGNRIQMRNRIKIYNSYTKKWALEQDGRRENLTERIRRYIFFEEGKELSEVIEDIIDNDELVDKTKWEKGNKWGQSVI